MTDSAIPVTPEEEAAWAMLAGIARGDVVSMDRAGDVSGETYEQALQRAVAECARRFTDRWPFGKPGERAAYDAAM